MSTALKPSALRQALEVCVKAKRPACVWGSPGIGKSDTMKQMAEELSRQLIDLRAVLLDPVDLRGLPTVKDGLSKWAIPSFLPREGTGILFLDELNRAPALVQNACFQLVLDRKLGEYVLPEDWTIVAACNPTGTGTTKMSDALASRFVHFDMEPDLTDWCNWAVSRNIEPIVIAFLRFRPELLHQYDVKLRSFPCPRTWEFVSQITASSPAREIEHALYVGAVGEGAAVEYSAFMKLFRELPSIDAILLDPVKSPVPSQPSTLFAIASALARRVNDGNFGRAVTYLNRLPAEYMVMSIKDAVTRDKTLCSTPEFTKWATANQEFFAK